MNAQGKNREHGSPEIGQRLKAALRRAAGLAWTAAVVNTPELIVIAASLAPVHLRLRIALARIADALANRSGLHADYERLRNVVFGDRR